MELNMPLINLLLLITAAIMGGLFFLFGYISQKEHEIRATSIFYVSGFLVLLLYSLLTYSDFIILKWILLGLPYFLLVIILTPSFSSITEDQIPGPGRIDERDVMFSRRILKKDTDRYDEYYTRFPDRKFADDDFRSKPGLLSKNSIFFNSLSFAAADASFISVESLASQIDGPANEIKQDILPGKLSSFIKNWTKHLGALDVGITLLEDYHLYSYRGRNHNYGNVVQKEHKYAIAFTVEMSKEMMDTAPKGPTVMESARKYMDAGVIAVQLAWFIRNLGYEARAHLDGNYEVVCPLVARDAGLGDIGRMGLLMTPNLGPRVRIGVVTCNIKLEADKRKTDLSMLDFCERCKKCAVVCPSKSISFSKRENIDGVKRWQINQVSCYDYWCTAGTDCGKCVSVCPYSHPGNFLHKIVRKGIKNSFLFRKMAVPLDDLFYGKKPKSKKIPGWMQA
ncbi:MAG: reductive dehalogenase domain-containing protein [Bacteroidales bacterium]|nr:reductive dehalogenase domain-containing protein [Bacteroidales bacterium]